MTGGLRVVAKYGTPEEAHLLRNRLLAAGIPAFLDGETAGSAWHLTNAIGGVKVLVPEEHLAAAEAILAPGDEQPTTSPTTEAGTPAVAERQIAEEPPSASWRCEGCGAEVDAAMDVCWACGTTKEETEPWAWGSEDDGAAEAEPKERRAVAPEVALFVVLFPPTLAYFLFTKLCHLLAPLVPDAKHHAPTGTVEPEEAGGVEPAGADEADHAAPQALGREEHALEHEERSGDEPLAPGERELDALVLRAWRAALMGFFLLPPLVMTLYSTWLLMQYWSRRRRAHRQRDRRALWTLLINLVAALCLGFLLAMAVAGYLESLYDSIRHAPSVMGSAREQRGPYLGH